MSALSAFASYQKDVWVRVCLTCNGSLFSLCILSYSDWKIKRCTTSNHFPFVLTTSWWCCQNNKCYGQDIQKRLLTAYNHSRTKQWIHRVLCVSLCLLAVLRTGKKNALANWRPKICFALELFAFAGAIQFSLNFGKCRRAGDLHQSPVCANECRPLFSGIQFRLPTSCSVDRTQPQPPGTCVLRHIIWNKTAWCVQWFPVGTNC